MAWISRPSNNCPVEKPTAEHMETVSPVEKSNLRKIYPFVSPQVSDSSLPFIQPSTVTAAKSDQGVLWIVVDNIVYDCTVFASKHPGGASIIESFRGADCSWQWWRFHSRKVMEKTGKPLRVGRTEGVENPYREAPKRAGWGELADAEEW